MTKPWLFPLLASFCLTISSAHSAPMDDKFFTEQTPKLTPNEQQALDIAEKWKSGQSTTLRPIAGKGGAVQFVFGQQFPTVICAVLQVCDIALEPGEKIQSIQLGDTARWNLEPATSGSPNGDIQHILLKPIDVGLNTSLVVATDRRSYHMGLRSDRLEFMPYVTFTYPDTMAAKWQQALTKPQSSQADNDVEAGNNLSFNYQISGNSSLKPVRVYNDGVRTFIEMPRALQSSEAPTLLVIRRERGLLQEPETAMVNYRLIGNRYIVDQVFDKAVLIAGVGRSQSKTTITRL